MTVVRHVCITFTIAAALGAIADPAPADDLQSSDPEYRNRVQSARRTLVSRHQQYEARVRDVRGAERRIESAEQRVKQAHAAIDEYVRNNRLAVDPARADAVSGIEQARQQLAAQRDRAIEPLRQQHDYRKLTRELQALRREMDQLNEQRAKAALVGFGFGDDERRRAVRIARRIRELDHEIYRRELELLDEHKPYQQADRELDLAYREAKITIAHIERLEKSDPNYKRVIAALREATQELRDARSALVAAQQGRTEAKLALRSASDSLRELESD